MNKKIIKNGSYSMAYTAILIAILVLINLIVAEIPEEYTKIDVTNTSMHTMTEATKEFLDTLEDEITIYYIVQNGNEDDFVENLLTKYEEYAKTIKVVKKDPVLYPTFVSQYTTDEISENSLIVVSGDKNRVVEYYDMYDTEMDYYTYSTTVTGFKGEGAIDSAISYVTTDELPIIYLLEGHGEMELPTTMQESLGDANYQIEALSLVAKDTVPDDAGCVMLVSPQTDISKEEAEKLLTYLENGGKVMFFIDYVGKNLENLESVLENYGVTTEYGVVMEGNPQNYVMQVPYYMLPNVESVEFTENIIAQKKYILFAIAQPFAILESYRDTLTIETFLKTSDQAYIKADIENMETYEMQEGDKVGEFPLALKITESVADEKETQIVCYAGSAILDESVNMQVSGANFELLIESIGWMCENETPVISVESKDLTTTYLVIPEYDAGYWGVITCGIIPAVFLLMGLIIWLKRRKQ